MVPAVRAMVADHDPGEAEARRRADAATLTARTRHHVGRADILVGTASWTDATLTAAGVFYPDDARTPEKRLRHYAAHFPLVEVDSSYYAIPARRNAELWVERTPADFVFDVKAFALMTGHATDATRLPGALRAALPRELASSPKLYAKELEPELRDEVWRLFADAVRPLHDAGKLGAVFLQYPAWVRPAAAAADMLERARERLGDLPVAVEFRHRDWLAPANERRTMDILAELGMSYVIVDAPPGMESSVPATVAVPTPRLAVVRMHGRRVDQWERRGATVLERFRYLYDEQELAPWVERVLTLAERADRVHVVFNNCYANYGVANALEFGALLRGH